MNTGKGAKQARLAHQRQSLPPEFLLLQACATLHPGPQAEAAIIAMLEDGIDWTRFVQKAIDHGLAGLAGHTLSRVGPAMVPADILAAFGLYLEETRIRNQALADELIEIIGRLALKGIDAIPFKGPTMAQQVYGDLGFRVFRDLDFLVRDADYGPAIAILGELGIRRNGDLTGAQYDMIHWIQGQEILRNTSSGTMIEPHTRLTARKLALDIDHAGLWHRAQGTMFNGHAVKLFAPEDQFLMLAVHGGKELWWRMNWACDIAEFIRSQPALDWAAILERARAQGCMRIVLLAGALARTYFGAAIPDQVSVLANSDPALAPMLRSIQARWAAEGTGRSAQRQAGLKECPAAA